MTREPEDVEPDLESDPAFDDPAFDDPAFDEVRALLRDARVDEPVPADVVARLDDTLARLRDEPQLSLPGVRRPSLAGVRALSLADVRRRWAPRVLAAAVVVGVLGLGAYAVLRPPDDTATTSDAQVEAGGAASDSSGGKALSRSSAPQAGSASGGVGSSAGAPASALRLETVTFADDAARIMTLLAPLAARAGTATPGATAVPPAPAAPTPAPDTTPSTGAQSLDRTDTTALTAPPVTATPAELARRSSGAYAGCAGPDAPGAVVVTATLDSQPVALVFRPPTDTYQVVEAWSCDGAELLAHAAVAH